MGAWFRWIRDLWLGRRQLGQTTERVTNTIAIGTAHLFNVSGGRIIVTSIIGELTIAVVAAAVNIRLQADPTIGTTRNLCANLNVGLYPIGDLLGITGVNTDPMIPPAAAGAVEAQTMGVVVKAGTIDLVSDATDAGSIRWTLHWMPLDSAASVASA